MHFAAECHYAHFLPGRPHRLVPARSPAPAVMSNSTLTITTTNATPPGSTTFTVLAANGGGTCQAGTASNTGTLVVVESTTTTLTSSVNPSVFGPVHDADCNRRQGNRPYDADRRHCDLHGRRDVTGNGYPERRRGFDFNLGAHGGPAQPHCVLRRRSE